MPGRGSNVSRWLPIMALVVVVMVGAVVVGALLSRALITEQPQETATVAPQTPTAETPIAMSDLPEVEIRAPSDNAEVVLGGEVGVYVRAVDRIGVTRIEMRVNNQPIDSAGSPDPNGALVLDSILSWTPTTPGRNVIQVVAYRGGIVGNPKTITVTVRDNAALPTQTPPPPGVTPLPPTFTATADPTCRVRINSSGINVRRGPGLNYEVITSLAFAAVVPVTGISPDGAWYQVNAVGFIGWVSTQFVTPLGFCGGIGVIAPPPSPIPAGGTQVVILPTWTPFPTLPLPTATSTIPVVVLPTLTATIYIPPQPGQVSVGDLTSTAIYATQTKLAQIPSPLPTNTPTVTPLPGETVAPTATPSDTPTVTPTPLLPDVIVSAIDLASTTVILDATTRQATLPVKVTVKNNGQALAPTFDVALRLFDGTAITKRTTVVLDLGAETTLDFDVTFKTEGVQTLTVIADSTNGVPESDKTNNVATREVTVIVATVTNPTATATPTDTATPDVTATPIPPTETPVPPTETLIPPPDTATPEPETATPEAPTTTPEPETATPEAPTTTPEPETATPEAPTTTPEPETATPEAPTTTPEPPTETPIPATAMPSISVQPSCTAELVASFVLINNGGAMSAPTAFTITNINGAVVLAGGDLLMEAGGSRVLTVQGVSGVLTLSIPQYQVFAQADCPVPTATAEPPTVTPEPATETPIPPTETPIPATAMPSISVQPSCTAELVASFVLINNGGAMSAPTAFTITNINGAVVLAGGDLLMEAGGSRVLTVQGVSGVLTLSIPQYQVFAQADCPVPATETPIPPTETPIPATAMPSISVQPSCTAELVASFVLINNGGAMSAPTAFTITNINGAVVLAGGDLLMEAGGSRVLTVQGVSGVLTLSIPQYQVFAQADCPVPTATAEPPTVTPEPATETPIPATPMPAISVQPSCTAELVASFVLINNGGAMSFPTSYTVVDSSGIPLLGGSDLQLEAGGNRVLTVQGIPGVITLNVPEYQLVSQANCPLPTATPEQATATPEPSVDIVDLGAVAVQPSLNNQTQQIMRGIHALWLQSGGTGNDFSLTGNGLLLGISDLYSQSANFDQYAGLAQSILDNYGAAVQALQGRYGQCNAGTPIQCPQGRSPLVFIDTVSVAMQTGTPVDTYRNDLTALVGQLAQQGMIPVLVTTPGRADDQALATYNTAVFRVAEANQLPLFNLYGIGAVNPALLDPFGKLTDPGAGARADFSAGVLATFGVNNAVLELMTLLEEVRTTIFTP
ncbi:MAG: SH3 domain-containing protein [Anaerolineales bacterium]|nr:SH3 domain-containing protein [Anaerolineales bacterium]